jgi:hypothetical protein
MVNKAININKAKNHIKQPNSKQRHMKLEIQVMI